MRVLVTGCAGFIGMHAADRLLLRGDEVVGVDNLNSYYDPQLKLDRLARLQSRAAFTFRKLDIAERRDVDELFEIGAFERVLHLAAQAGVRYSLTNPHAYVDSNLVGFLNILEACRRHDVKHLVYASSSSVYGGNTKLPFSERESVDHPVSFYAATKKANEVMAHSYSHLFGLPTSGLRFFTVYGPWGRPDMALFMFTKAILDGDPIEVYNNGMMSRDFTYIDDVIEGVIRTIDKVATPDEAFNPNAPRPDTSDAPFRVFNIGSNSPVKLLDFVASIERALGRSAEKVVRPMQAGDVKDTRADVSSLDDWIGFRPSTPIDVGVARFVDWYRTYYGR